MAPDTEPRPIIRRAGDVDLDEVAEVLGDAFQDYPWTRWTVDARDHRARVTALQRLFAGAVGLPHGQVWVATIDERVEAAAVWMDSSVSVPDHVWAALAERQRELEGDRHEASQAGEALASGLRPSAAHRFLGSVGTRRSRQGQGLARALLAPVLDDCDRTGSLAYLETSSEANVSFYESLGFAITTAVEVPGGPPFWAMVRQPR